MVSKYRIRRLFRPLVEWIARQFHKIKLTPTQVSVMGTLFALGGCLFFIFIANYWGSLLFAICIFIAGLLDGVDGALARLTNTVSIKGGYFDSVLDRYADAFIVIAFLGHYFTQPLLLGVPLLIWVIIALTGVIMVSFIRTKGETMGFIDCDVGLAGRSERLIILVICALINYGYIGLIIVGIISHLTAIYRIYYIHKSKLE